LYNDNLTNYIFAPLREEFPNLVNGGNKMKLKTMKLTTALIAALFLVIGCGSSAPSSGGSSGVNTGPSRTAKKSGGNELDNALREISDYLNKRIKEGSKAVFLNIKSDWPDLSDYILSTLAENAVNDEVFSVVDRQQLDAIRSELNFQWSGEVSDDSAQEIGQMLGAQSIVSGTITTIGSVYRIQVRAIAVQTAAVQGQFSQNVDGKAPTVAALTKRVVPAGSGASGASTASGGTAGTRTQTGTTTTSGTGGQTAQPAASGQPAAPMAQPAIAYGTYTFFPRLRAMEGGRDIDAYLDKIVVRGGYLNIYLERKPTGSSDDSPQGENGWYSGVVNYTLQDLDNPRYSYNPISVTYERPRTLTFEKIRPGKRFSLTYTYGKVPVVFEEFDLSKAQYEQNTPPPPAPAVSASASAAIANGTYIFYPRLRAMEGGRDINAYLDKIVVRGGYVNIYLEGKPSGSSDAPQGENGWYGRLEECTLINLDNPRQSHNPVSISYERPRTLSFQNIKGKRFSLTYTRGKVPVIFEEIDLSKAEYEP
jgi:hypothetical protein